MTDEQRVHAALQKNAPAALDRVARAAHMDKWDTFTTLVALEAKGKATVVGCEWTTKEALEVAANRERLERYRRQRLARVEVKKVRVKRPPAPKLTREQEREILRQSIADERVVAIRAAARRFHAEEAAARVEAAEEMLQ